MSNEEGYPIIILRMPPNVDVKSMWLDINVVGEHIINVMYLQHDCMFIKEIDVADLKRPGTDPEHPDYNPRL